MISQENTIVDGVSQTGGDIMDSLGAFMTSISEGVGQYGLKIVGGIVALIIGLWIVKMIMKAVTKAFEKSKIDSTLKPFLLTCLLYTSPSPRDA